MTAHAKRHLAFLHTLPCAVTYRLTGALIYDSEVNPVVVHHPESVRDEWSDYAGIPMLEWRHKQLHKLSRHGFERLTKLSELDLLATTIFFLQNDFAREQEAA